MSNNLNVTLSEFLQPFFPEESEQICLRAFKPKTVTDAEAEGKPQFQPCKIHANRRKLARDKELQAKLKRINKTRGVYFVPNSGGDTKKSIKRFNACFNEADDCSIAKQHAKLDACPLDTSIRVETKNSVHGYWLLKGPCSAEDWERVQLSLIEHFQSDDSIKDASRVMRLPFFFHVSKNGAGLAYKRIELAQFEPDRRYTVEQLLTAFPPNDSSKQGKHEPQNNASHSDYPTWDDIHSELARRLMAHESYKVKGEWATARGLCHNGHSDNAIHRNLLTGKVHCKNGCEYAAILRGYGLPERPDEGGTAESTWPDPAALGEETPAVEPLLPEMLPEAFRPWLSDVAERMNVPLDYPAAAAIVALTAVVGRRARIIPKVQDRDWLVVPNLWGGVIGRPGTQKTPAISEAMSGLRQLEKSALADYEVSQASYSREVDRFKIEQEAWRENAKKAAKAGKTYEDFGDERPAEPAARRFVTNDATAEKLHELLRDNPGGLLYFRDELSGWLAMLERPDRSTDRAFLLESWVGLNGHTIDRIGRGTVYAPVCCVSVFGGIQPSKLRAYLADAANGGLTDDGMLQRLQVLVWPDPLKEWKLVDHAPHYRARDKFTKTFESLARLDPEEPVNVQFDDEAQELFYVWWMELETRLRDESLHESFVAHLSKYRSLMPSLALLFMLAAWTETAADIPRVGIDCARKAAAWCAYLESHARKVYARLMTGGLMSAQVLAEKIQSGALPQLFTARDVYRPQWAGLTGVEEAERAIAVLIDHHWLRLEQDKEDRSKTGGRPAKLYRVNPKVDRKEAV
jgi:putative DNA primase/helicase